MSNQVEIKSEDEIAYMREAGRIVCEILDALEKAVVPGITTWELDQLAESLTYKKGAKPSFKGYLGFPACLCTSVNHEVIHGIPSKRKVLAEGDLMKLDFGAVFKGYHGDSARTVAVGKVSSEAAKLSMETKAALFKGIDAMQVGNRIGDIGYAVESHVQAHGYSVVRDFVGHGIGKKLHEAPQVPNYGSKGTGMKLRVGMVLAVEPMVNAGTERVEVLDDDWTAITVDRKLSCHFEHTIAILSTGPEVLTRLA